MNKPKKLITTANLVKAILEVDPQTRNSDSLLYLRVLEHCAIQSGVNIEKISVPEFLSHYLQNYNFPCFETVRRTRQKIQAEFPELSCNLKVKKMRSEKEQEYRAFSKAVIR